MRHLQTKVGHLHTKCHGERYVGSLFRVDEPVPDDSGKSGDLQSAKAQLNTWRTRNLIDYDDTEGLIKKVKQLNS